MTVSDGVRVLVVSLVSWSVLCRDGLQLQQHTAASILTHLAVDYNSGNIYLGGNGSLLALGKNLTLIQEKKLMSVFDSPYCFAAPASCDSPSDYVPNFVTTLVLNTIHNYLLVCGSVGQGTCSIHSVSDLNQVLQFNTTHHASFIGSMASSVAFFGKPPAGYNKNRRMLYVAIATYDRTKDEFSPYTISTREIIYNNSYASIDYLIDNDALSDYSYLSVFHSVQKNFRVKYIYGFELNGYGYYISIQPVDADSSKTHYMTKLIQFCQDDRYYKTYVEIPLTCSVGSTVFTIATAAYLSVSEDEGVLAVSFGRPDNSHDSEPDPAYGSVVCNFPIGTARYHVAQTQKRCFNHGAGTHPWWIYGQQSDCIISSNVYVYDGDCSYDNTQDKIGVVADDEDLDAVFDKAADICLDEMITAIVLTNQMQRPTAVLGTHDGLIIKASLNGGNCDQNIPDMRYHLSLDAIQQQMSLDIEQKHVYVLSGNTVTRFPLDSCAMYSECSTCVNPLDLLSCGWCGDYCFTRDQCVDPNTPWLHDTCQPIINSIFPSSGPTAGGTMLTIKGNNFGSKIPEVYIGNSTVKCVISKSDNTMVTCTTYPTNVTGESSVTVTARDLTMASLRYKVDGTVTTTDLKFDYKTPTLASVSPDMGPESGGTKVALVGTNLNIGQSQSVSIGSAQCDITGMNATVIECTTQKAPTLLGSDWKRPALAINIILAIDGAQLSGQPPITFQYMENSIIYNISPTSSIFSGGTTVTVAGTNLHIVQKPQIGVIMADVTDRLLGDCVSEVDGRMMHCKLPSIMPVMHNLDPHVVSIFFLMDGIERLQNLIDTQTWLSHYVYFPNPKLYKFDGEERLMLFDVSQNFLEIKGDNLNLGILSGDYHVTVGMETCNMSTLEQTKLMCRPAKPASIADSEPRRAVKVKVGMFLEYDIGKLIYVASAVDEVELSMGIVVLIVVLLLLIVAIVLVVVVMKRNEIGPFRDKEAEAPHRMHQRELIEEQQLLDQNRYNEPHGPPVMLEMSLSGEDDGPPPPMPASSVPLDGDELDHRAEQGAGGSGAGNYRQGLDEETIAMLNEQSLLIERQRLQLGKKIGSGHFGRVLEGFLTVEGQNGDKLVAVKILHQDSPREIDVKAFTKEALIMKDFNHPNVLSLIGISLGMNDMPLVVLPYMEHGDLLSYIRDKPKDPTIKDVINFAINICDGMIYLSEHKCVHRDLASRNCMLDTNINVKVADFGLSREIYEKDYYTCQSKNPKVPVKWMALECLEKGKYSSKSDVWSFGIVIWELFARGVCPYPEVDNWDIVRYLKQGRRMPQPYYCPDHLYQMMRKCWHPNPKDRPAFTEIGRDIRDMLQLIEHPMHQGEESVDIEQSHVDMDRCTDYHYTEDLMPPASPPSGKDDGPPPTMPIPPVPLDGDELDHKAEQGAGNYRQETIAMHNEQSLIIERQRLQLGKQIGRGNFGSVFEGFLTFKQQKGRDLVAVKILHQDSPREIHAMGFTKEAHIMKDFNHPNVLSLIGICLGMDDMPLYVLSYMEHGDLLSYIRDETKNPTKKDLIKFAINICDGMTYLSERKCVHRYLAARNCLLDKDFNVKVADFGLSRDLHTSASKTTMLHVEWMALECLIKGKYSSKSDVWSFGIVIWELFTRGQKPYPGVHNWDIVKYLKHGRRMPQSQYCPNHLYQIMRKCWHPYPKNRPAFAEIGRDIRDMLTMMEHAMHQGAKSVDIEQIYVNMDIEYHYTGDELDHKGAYFSPRSLQPKTARALFRHIDDTEIATEDTEYLQPWDVGDRPTPKGKAPENKHTPVKKPKTQLNDTEIATEDTEYLQPWDVGDRPTPKGKAPENKHTPVKKPKKQLSKGDSLEEAPFLPDKVNVKPEATVARDDKEIATEDTEYLQPWDVGDRPTPKGKAPENKHTPVKKPKKQLSKGDSLGEAPFLPDKVKVKPEATVAGGGQGDSVA